MVPQTPPGAGGVTLGKTSGNMIDVAFAEEGKYPRLVTKVADPFCWYKSMEKRSPVRVVDQTTAGAGCPTIQESPVDGVETCISPGTYGNMVWPPATHMEPDQATDVADDSNIELAEVDEFQESPS